MSDVFLVTGGTGSFGHTMVSHLLETTDAEVRVFSRDEAKQDAMRSRLNNQRVKFFLGDIRDRDSLQPAVKGSNYVFHAAALKQVPSAEFFPMEYVKTNVVGTENLLRLSIREGVRKVVCLSTDKAVYPINAMGISKAMMEKVALSYAREGFSSGTSISVTRYGNVLMSRGSVVPRFLEQLAHGEDLTITNPNMTRFLMTLSDSVDLVMRAFSSDDSGDILVRKAPACTIGDLAEAVIQLRSGGSGKTRIVGVRHAEKLYESLLSSEELAVAEDLGSYFRIPLDDRDLNYEKYFDVGTSDFEFTEGFHSHNALRLSASEASSVLSKLPGFLE